MSALLPEAIRALAMFRRGKDTYDIAKTLGMTEAFASRLVYEARCQDKVLPVETVSRKRRVA